MRIRAPRGGDPPPMELTWSGKRSRLQVLDTTPSAPWIPVGGTEDPQAGPPNLLVLGDNGPALRYLVQDQGGPDALGTRDRIRLIYVDPPFASGRRYLLDGEVAFEDCLSGAAWLDFFWERLVLLVEVLAWDGCLFVHLDSHMVHPVKVLLDELLGEACFRNAIVWHYYNKMQGHVDRFASNHDVILYYARGGPFHKQREPRARPVRQLKRRWDREKKALVNAKEDGRVVFREVADRLVDDVWRLPMLQPADRTQRTGYPTQKPEALLERILQATTNEGDLVLDPFCGSGTTPAVASRLRRRWIAMDQGSRAVEVTESRLRAMGPVAHTLFHAREARA